MLSLQEEEILAEEVQKYPLFYNKKKKFYHQKNVVTNALEKVARHLTFVENEKNVRTFIEKTNFK